MLYGHITGSNQHSVPDHALLATDLATDTARTAMGPPPEPSQATKPHRAALSDSR